MICPNHRYYYGTKFVAPQRCYHPEHSSRNPKVALFPASLSRIKQLRVEIPNSHFQIGVRICRQCMSRKAIAPDPDDEEYLPITLHPLDRQTSLNTLNTYISSAELNISPAKRTRKPFGKISLKQLTRIRNKFGKLISHTTLNFKNSIFHESNNVETKHNLTWFAIFLNN
jgi:hypothetical protein